MTIDVSADGKLTFQDKHCKAALGRSGIIAALQKREGDGATPTGKYPIRSIWFRSDRVQLPTVPFPVFEITRTDGWCDEPLHPDYNRHVILPFVANHETLWREDHRYDVLVVLGHNDDPPVANMGSCIFWHIAAPNYTPTEGCVAVNLQDMLAILEKLTPTTTMHIHQ